MGRPRKKPGFDPEKEMEELIDRVASEYGVNLRILGIGEGDEVLVPAYTYTATASAAIHAGAAVKFIDSQKDNCEMDYDALENAVTEKTEAVIPVDLGGVRIYSVLHILHSADSNNRYYSRPGGCS